MRICFLGLENPPVLALEHGHHNIAGEGVQQTLLARALQRRGCDVSMAKSGCSRRTSRRSRPRCAGGPPARWGTRRGARLQFFRTIAARWPFNWTLVTTGNWLDGVYRFAWVRSRQLVQLGCNCTVAV